MDALELKLSLIEQLKTIDDVKLLTQIKNLISIATEKKETRYPARIQKRIRYDNGRIT